MLDLTPLEEHTSVAETCRSIAMEVIAPAARQAEADHAVPSSVWKALLETGLSVPVAEDLGGDGVPDALTQMIAIENLAYGDPGITLAAVWHGAVAYAVGQHGAATHRALLSTLMSDAGARAGLALYEGFGRGPAELQTTIEVADGSLIVRGRKAWVPFAGEAVAYLVVGVDPVTRDLRLATVPGTTTGIKVSRPSRVACARRDCRGLGGLRCHGSRRQPGRRRAMPTRSQSRPRSSRLPAHRGGG